MSWKPGETVVLREMWRGKIWAARPVTVVEDSPAQQTFFVHPGMRWKCPSDPSGRWLRLPPDGGWALGDRIWTHTRALSFAWPGSAHSMIAYWDDRTDAFLRWYINLQTPLRRTSVGFDYMDHALDAIVEPDLSSWSWKDEEELREALERGLFTQQEADGFYAEGERAAERLLRGDPPFDRDRREWKPDPSWPVAELPPGWDSIEVLPGPTSTERTRRPGAP